MQSEKSKRSFLGKGSREYDSVEMDRQWSSIFRKYDADGDGWIPLTELKTLLQKNTQSDISNDLPHDVIDEILERADWDNDQRLSYDEFLHMVHGAELGAARPRFQRLVRIAALAVLPQKQRATAVRKYFEEYNCMPPPIFMILMSVIEVVVFAYYCVEMKEIGAAGPIPVHSPLIYNPYRRKEAWRYVSYMLIHAGAIHIFFNLLIQLLLGIPLEMVHKWWRTALVYLAGVAAGSLGSSLSDPYTYLAGASGGVYALIAAHLASVILNFKEMEFAWFRLATLFFFAAADIGTALYYRYAAQATRTSYAAHFAGALAGLMVGVAVLRNLKVHKWETIIGWVMLALYFVLMFFAILWNAFYNNYYPVQEV